jgi:PAS domain S-box-containing protein
LASFAGSRLYKMYPHVAVVLTDALRQIIWVNHDFTILTGYSLLEVLGKKPSILQGANTSPEDIAIIRQNLQDLVSFKHSIINYTKEKREYKCSFVIHPIFDDNGILTNFIAFEVDAEKVDEAKVPLLQLKEKYQTSSLKDSDQTLLYIKLCTLLQQEKLYLNPDLSLKDLANRLRTNTRYLSQVINTLAGYNLQHFINSYRIEEVKKKIIGQELRDLTLYGIAQQCGFKNKSTFYKVFQEITGQTPKKYLKELNIAHFA